MWTLKDLPIPTPTYLTREEIIAIEHNEFDTGVNAFELMKNAGLSIANTLKVILKTKTDILILAGSGNNGGDGSVAAKHLVKFFDVTIIYIKIPKSSEAKAAYSDIINTDVTILKITEDISLDEILERMETAEVIVDAIFGTGLKSRVRTPTNLILNKLSQLENPNVISIDIPSGMDCNTGEWYCDQFSPKTIISMQFSKKCFIAIEEDKETYPDLDIFIVDIGIKPTSYSYITGNYIKQFWPVRDLDSHKGQNGRVMVIGGSDEFTGAPVLTGLATMRSGIDTLRIAVPESIRDIVASYAEDFIVVKVDGKRITSKSFKKYRDMAVNRHDVIVIGMGLSNHPDCTKFVREFFEFAKGKVNFVIDAEAVRAFRGNLEELKDSGAILTPHKSELRMMFNERIPDEMPELIEYVQQKALDLGVVILLKGMVDIITNGRRTLLNMTGHPGMTVGGSGDVLAGVAAASYNFIDDPFIAAAVSAYLMGRAGEMCAEEFGYSLMASDIIQAIPKVLLSYDVNR